MIKFCYGPLFAEKPRVYNEIEPVFELLFLSWMMGKSFLFFPSLVRWLLPPRQEEVSLSPDDFCPQNRPPFSSPRLSIVRDLWLFLRLHTEYASVELHINPFSRY